MKQKKIEQSIAWLLAAYIAMHLLVTGHFSLKYDPRQQATPLCSALVSLMLAAPVDSLGDGPGNR